MTIHSFLAILCLLILISCIFISGTNKIKDLQATFLVMMTFPWFICARWYRLKENSQMII